MSKNVIPFPSDPGRKIARRALEQCRRETAEDGAERCLIAETVASFHIGRQYCDLETAHLWALADILEESLDWTEEQRRAVAQVLHLEVAERVGRRA